MEILDGFFARNKEGFDSDFEREHGTAGTFISNFSFCKQLRK